MSDILLVNPLFLNQDPVEQRLVTPYFPLGLLYLAAVARDAGYDVAVFDAMFETSDDAFRGGARPNRPRLVGIAALATVRAAVCAWLASPKRPAPSSFRVAQTPPAGPKSISKAAQTRPVDVVVVGEGEQTFLELLRD